MPMKETLESAIGFFFKMLVRFFSQAMNTGSVFFHRQGIYV